MKKKLNVAVLGTGNIGADLLFKIINSQHLNCVLFSGRNNRSTGLKKIMLIELHYSLVWCQNINLL